MTTAAFGRSALLSEPRSNHECRRSFSEMADRCNLHLIHSPSPPIPPGPYPPIFEFVTQQWSQQSKITSASAGQASGEKPQPSEAIKPSQVAMIDGVSGLQRTFGDYHTTATRLAAALSKQFGVDEDECVAMYCPNHVDYLPVTLAASLLGAKMTPVNPLYTTHELEVVLQRSRSSVLIVHNSTLPVAMSTAAKCPGVKGIVVLNDDGRPLPEGCVDLSALCQEHSGAPVVSTNRVVAPQTPIHPFLLPYSSGTTGLPKGVVLTHQNIIANMLQLEVVEGPDFLPSHKLITPLPYFHIYAFTVSMLYCAWKGQAVITTSGRFDLETFCQLVERHKPERAHLVPPILLQLSKNPVVDRYDLSSLRMIVSAAAPLSKETEADVWTRIGCRVKQAWGMSELSPIGAFVGRYSVWALHVDFACLTLSLSPLQGPLPPTRTSGVAASALWWRRRGARWWTITGTRCRRTRPGSSASRVRKVRVRFVCSVSQRRESALSVVDSLHHVTVMLGYMDEPDKTAECLSSTGWLRTGDLAYYDEDGFFYISDRLKELIKVRGYPVRMLTKKCRASLSLYWSSRTLTSFCTPFCR
jgi:acyl-CoA synthetase (AMP-forming)/AMP-acid ligase II